jgi:hypothetical protein
VGWITPRGIDMIESLDAADKSPAPNVVFHGDAHFGDRYSQEIKTGIGTVEAPMGHSTITKPQSRSFIGKLIAAAKSLFTGS